MVPAGTEWIAKGPAVFEAQKLTNVSLLEVTGGVTGYRCKTYHLNEPRLTILN